MRKIKVEKWKSRVPRYEGEGSERKVVGYDEIDEDILVVLNVLIGNKKPEEIPKGLDKFRLFGRLTKSFDKADKNKVLELEEVDYKFLRETIEKDVPSTWGFNENISKAIEEFMNAKEE